MAIRNYLKVFADGHTEATVEKPTFGEVSASGDYYINGLWYDKLGVVYPTQFTYMAKDDKLATFLIEDGQPVDITYDYDSPSIVQNVIQAKDIIASGEFKGKNACTAWVNFDGTTTPPTIKDSYNVDRVDRIVTGQYEVYFEESMDNLNYSSLATGYNVVKLLPYSQSLAKVGVRGTLSNDNNFDLSNCQIAVFGGKN